MTLALILVLALPAAWWCGHHTARIRIVYIGATPDDDQAAFLADERARFNALVAGLNLDDDPKGDA